MPIVLGNDTGVSAASSSFNHYLLVILWSWQFLVIIISDFGYLVTLLMSIVLIWGALFWFAGLLLSTSVWVTWVITKEIRLFRKSELSTTIYYRYQVKKSAFIFAKFLVHVVVLVVSRKGDLFAGLGQFLTWLVVVGIPFWGALIYAVKIRREEGEFEEGIVKGMW